MKVKVNRKQLVNGLKSHNEMLKGQGKNAMPILQCIRLTAKDDVLFITSTDLESVLKTSLDCENGIDLDVAINLKQFTAALKSSKAETIELMTEGPKLHFSDGLINLTLEGIDAAEYPKIPFDVNKAVMIGYAQGQVLSQGLKKVIPAMSNDEMRYNLNSVFVEFDTFKLAMTLTATDGHRLHQTIIQFAPEYNALQTGEKGVIIASKAIKILSKFDTDQDISIFNQNDNIRFIGNDFELTTRRIVAIYPDYTQVIPKKSGDNILALTADNLKTLKQLNILPLPEGYQTKRKLSVKNLKLTLNGKILAQAVVGKENIPVSNQIELQGSYEGSELVTGYNLDFIIDALESFGDIYFDTDNELSVLNGLPQVNSIHNAILNRVLIMPVRIND